MKLRVENLARIKEAEVDVKNLTLFVGQNSTHKSYMAHVIYESAIIGESKELLERINQSFNTGKDILKNIFIENKDFNQDDLYYFPASRSGYTLALEAIYAGMFSNSVRGRKNPSRLTDPTIDFIEEFYNIKTKENYSNTLFSLGAKNTDKLINFLQSNIIKGKIVEDINEFNYSNYYLKVEDKKIDLHLASSATLEILPFIVFLKNTLDISKTFFVIEEPEAHLHPKAQIQMARFIVMLSNAGAKVLVTTHSDYILNEINNCIKQDSLNEKSEFSISKDNVSAYLFKNEDEETSVKNLEINKFGISNDNFDEALEELLDLSNELNERIIDNE